MNKIAVEVGANVGSDTKVFLDKGYTVYAFEPLIEASYELMRKFKDKDNYYPMPLAVDIVDGWARFNVSGINGWGCSSLLNFNPAIDAMWTGRNDFKVTDSYRVPTMRLDTFMNIYKIDHIDYLWIDAQGKDFQVLQSLGERIKDVVEGRCEVAFQVNLYDGVKNDHVSVCNWLLENGFSVEIQPHDHQKEADVLFKRNQ